MEKLPILGKTYNHYDDGKIKESRLMKSVVTGISEFNDKLLSQEDKEDIGNKYEEAESKLEFLTEEEE